MSAIHEPPVYGLLAEFEGPKHLLRGVAKMRELGYSRVESFTPYPVDGMGPALGFRPWAVPMIFLVAAVASAAAGYFMQYYAAVVSYPINVGGRPLHSWPSFIPITFESAILGGVLSGALGTILLNRLPRYSHPVSNVERFLAASSDAFFLCVESSDPHFQRKTAADDLRGAGAIEVTEIPQ